MNLRALPIGMYGAVMGLAGLGLSARAAAPLFPGVFRAPAWFTEPWILAGAIAFCILVPLYVAKAIRHPDVVKGEFTNPAQMGFCGALPVGLSILCGGLAPYLPALAGALWVLAVAFLLALQVWAVLRWLQGGIELAQVNAGWLIMTVGGIVMPGPGLALGYPELSRFIFGVSASLAIPMGGLLLYRAACGPALPEVLRPSWFIILVPPSLIYANGVALYPDAQALELLFYLGLVLAAGLLLYAVRWMRAPFGPTWWAFTFPLDALAYAALRHAQQHPGPVWQAIAAATLCVATLFVAMVLLRTLAAAMPRSAASPAA